MYTPENWLEKFVNDVMYVGVFLKVHGLLDTRPMPRLPGVLIDNHVS
jgi:hypothetical protein